MMMDITNISEIVGWGGGFLVCIINANVPIHKNIQEAFNEEGVEILSPQYIAARDGNLSTVPGKVDADSKSPIEKIVDHLTGKNQRIIGTTLKAFAILEPPRKNRSSMGKH